MRVDGDDIFDIFPRPHENNEKLSFLHKTGFLFPKIQMLKL